MTMKEIEQRIAKEMNDYNLQKFTGKIPANTLDLFKKAFMSVSVDRHKLPPHVVKTIAGKKIKDLTNVEVRQAFNLIILADPQIFYKDFESAISGYEVISNTMIDLNIALNKKKEEWDEKKLNFIQLAGLDINQRTPKLHVN